MNTRIHRTPAHRPPRWIPESTPVFRDGSGYPSRGQVPPGAIDPAIHRSYAAPPGQTGPDPAAREPNHAAPSTAPLTPPADQPSRADSAKTLQGHPPQKMMGYRRTAIRPPCPHLDFLPTRGGLVGYISSFCITSTLVAGRRRRCSVTYYHRLGCGEGPQVGEEPQGLGRRSLGRSGVEWT